MRLRSDMRNPQPHHHSGGPPPDQDGALPLGVPDSPFAAMDMYHHNSL